MNSIKRACGALPLLVLLASCAGAERAERLADGGEAAIAGAVPVIREQVDKVRKWRVDVSGRNIRRLHRMSTFLRDEADRVDGMVCEQSWPALRAWCSENAGNAAICRAHCDLTVTPGGSATVPP